MSVSITYDDGSKKIILTDSVATIYQNFKTITCKSARICKELLNNIYVEHRDEIYALYLQSPKLSRTTKRRLEIVDEYETYAFDVDRAPQKIKDLVVDLEAKIRHGEWDSHESSRKFQRAIDESPLRFFRKKK